MARIVAVVGATAQAGTTRVALNLARCLAQLGQQRRGFREVSSRKGGRRAE